MCKALRCGHEILLVKHDQEIGRPLMVVSRTIIVPRISQERGLHLRFKIRMQVAHGYQESGMPKQLFHRDDMRCPVFQ